MTVGERGIIIATERCRAGHGLEEHDAERVDVGPAIDGSTLTLFGRHILRRTHASSGTRQSLLRTGEHLCDPKIGEDGAGGGVHQHIDGFDIAVNDALFMRVGEGFGQL